MILQDLRNYIVTNTNVLAELPNAANYGVVQINKISQDAPTTRVLIRQRSQEKQLNQNGVLMMAYTDVDIECMSEDLSTAQDLAEVIKAELHGYRGLLNGSGSTRVMSMLVEDHSDDYTPKGIDSDEGEHVAALDISIQS